MIDVTHAPRNMSDNEYVTSGTICIRHPIATRAFDVQQLRVSFLFLFFFLSFNYTIERPLREIAQFLRVMQR